MYIKLVGALLIVAGCGGYGLLLRRSHFQTVRALRQLHTAVQMMDAELAVRMTPLPELCRIGAEQAQAAVGSALNDLGVELDKQQCASAGACMGRVLDIHKELPGQVRAALAELGNGLGRFDLDGQRTALVACARDCERYLKELELNQSQRLRDGQTLSFCAGAALAILLF